MSKRRRFSEREVIETLFHQGVLVPCFRCKNAIRQGERVQREHIHELALEGPDIPANCRYSHKLCHDVVTNGTKATSAGSSKHRIAKAKRIEREETFVVKRTTTPTPGGGLVEWDLEPAKPKRRWPKQSFPNRREYLAKRAT